MMLTVVLTAVTEDSSIDRYIGTNMSDTDAYAQTYADVGLR